MYNNYCRFIDWIWNNSQWLALIDLWASADRIDLWCLLHFQMDLVCLNSVEKTVGNTVSRPLVGYLICYILLDAFVKTKAYATFFCPSILL